MIRWTFYFNDGNVKSEVRNEEEDQNIQEWIDESRADDLLYLPSDTSDMYINRSHVKAITREIVTESQNATETPEAA